VYFAHPSFRLSITHCELRPTAGVSAETSQKLRNEKFSGDNRLTASGQAANTPSTKTIRNPHTATFPAVMIITP
jgi:hypothetical protein